MSKHREKRRFFTEYTEFFSYKREGAKEERKSVFIGVICEQHFFFSPSHPLFLCVKLMVSKAHNPIIPGFQKSLNLQPLNETNMEYGKLIAVTGMPGLYELISSKTDGAIVRSLEDNSTKFASTRQHQFSHLESIEVYTVRDNVNLTDVFKAMEADGSKLPDEKDAKAVKKYFEKVFPDMDFERVYSSDMKKMVKWYAIIQSKNIEIKVTEVVEEEETPAPAEEQVVEEKPVKKAAKPATKKAEPKSKEPKEEKEATVKPAKKAAKPKAAKKKEE